MAKFELRSIGRIECTNKKMRIVLDDIYAPTLIGLDGFSHILVLWWFSETDDCESRSTLTEDSPYKNAPSVLGIFSTRSPRRPNPIALSCARITYIDHENVIIGLTYIDGLDDSPVLDIKPYSPCLDRVEYPSVPEWCNHWPRCYETSDEFDWENEIKK